ncbi:MAG: hypothetical protein WKF68_00850 [Daejeonella sp.]
MIGKVLGKNPSGEDLVKIKRSPNFRNGTFHNLSATQITLKEASFFKMLYNFLNKPQSATPPKALPSVKTDLRSLHSEKPVIVWFGHSSYLIKYKESNILVDPIFSGSASPVSAFANSFPGSDIYSPEDFREIDTMILTLNQWVESLSLSQVTENQEIKKQNLLA